MALKLPDFRALLGSKKANDAEGVVVDSTHRVLVGITSGIMLVLTIGVVILINIVSTDYYQRFDLTRNNLNSLTPATVNLVRGMNEHGGIKITVFISKDLPRSIDLPGGVLPVRHVAQRFRDTLEEYAARGGGSVQIEYVKKDILDKAKRAKLPIFAGRLASKSSYGFRNHVIAAQFSYGTAVEKFPERDLSQLNPATLELQITRRLIKLKKRIETRDRYDHMLRVGMDIRDAVQACAKPIEEVGKDSGEALEKLLQNTQNRQAHFEKYRAIVDVLRERCEPIRGAVQEVGRTNAGADLEPLVGLANEFGLILDKLLGFLDGTGLPAEPQARMQEEMNALQAPVQLVGLAAGLTDRYEKLEKIPGESKVAFLCAGEAFCPFPQRESQIKDPDIRDNEVVRRVIGNLKGFEDAVNNINRKVGELFFGSHGYATVRVNAGDPIPNDVTALIIMRPAQPFDDESWYPVDQFILSGKPVIVFAGMWSVALNNLAYPEGDSFGKPAEPIKNQVVALPNDLAERMQAYGVRIDGSSMVADTSSNDKISIIYQPDQGPRVQANVNYPLLPRVNDLGGMKKFRGTLSGVTLPFPVEIHPVPERLGDATFTPLMRSSGNAVLLNNPQAEPGPLARQIRDAGKRSSRTLAAEGTGTLKSYFPPDKLPIDEQARMSHITEGDVQLLVIGSHMGLEGISVNQVVGSLDPQALQEDMGILFTKLRAADLYLQNWDFRIRQLFPVISDNMKFIHNILDWATIDPVLGRIGPKITRGPPLYSNIGSMKDIWTWGLIAGLPWLVWMFGFVGYVFRQNRNASRKEIFEAASGAG